MRPDQQPDHRGPVLFLVLLVMVGLIVIAWGVEHPSDGATPDVEPVETPTATSVPDPVTPEPHVTKAPPPPEHVFGRRTFLVAYYGTGQTPALGVLGENRPDVMDRRLTAAAKPFARGGYDVQHV